MLSKLKDNDDSDIVASCDPDPVDPVAPVVFVGTKIAEGAPLPEGRFTFGVLDAAGDLIATATNDANGGIVFPTVFFTTVGTFQYTIRELTQTSEEWITDPTIFPVVITTRMVGADLVAEVVYPNGTPVFVDVSRENVVCPVTAHQTVRVCVPVSVRPFARVGDIDTTCCGAPVITPGNNVCPGIPNGICNFTISQRICMDVPVQFGTEINTGETFVECQGISTTITCAEECAG